MTGRDCEQLVRLHRPRMLAVARRILGGDQGAEDCVQDALISALREIHRFEGRSSLATWLHRITVNAALMSLRARRRRNEEPIEELLPQFDSNDCRIEPLLNVPERPDTLLARSEIPLGAWEIAIQIRGAPLLTGMPEGESVTD